MPFSLVNPFIGSSWFYHQEHDSARGMNITECTADCIFYPRRIPNKGTLCHTVEMWRFLKHKCKSAFCLSTTRAGLYLSSVGHARQPDKSTSDVSPLYRMFFSRLGQKL